MAIAGENEKKEYIEGMEVIQPEVETQNNEEEKNEEQRAAAEKQAQIDAEAKKEAQPELNDDAVLAYFKSQGKEIESLDDIWERKEVEKIVEKNKWEDVIDEEDEAFFEYKRETGRTRKQFDYLNEDIGKKDALKLSIDRLKQDTGLTALTDAEAKSYLEEELQIDLNDEDAGVRNKIALNKYAKPRRDELVAQQEKYRGPIEAKKLEREQAQVEMVTLDNGEQMPKAEYTTLVNDRNSYVKSITEAVDRVAAFDFDIPVDINGEKQSLKISYDLSKEDKHSMLSDALDVDATIQRRFNTKDGFNHSELSETLFRGDAKNFNNIIHSVAEKVRAATIAELMADDNNENYSSRQLHQSKKTEDGYVNLENLG